jgi:hypothetical protein
MFWARFASVTGRLAILLTQTFQKRNPQQTKFMRTKGNLIQARLLSMVPCVYSRRRTFRVMQQIGSLAVCFWLATTGSGWSANPPGPLIEAGPDSPTNTPAQKKIHPALWEAVREHRGLPPQSDALRTSSHLIPRPDGRLLVTIKAAVTPGLLTSIQQSGGVLLSASPKNQTTLAEIPVASLDVIANLADVTDIQPAYFCDNASSATNVPSAFVPTVSGMKPRPRSPASETNP